MLSHRPWTRGLAYILYQGTCKLMLRLQRQCKRREKAVAPLCGFQKFFRYLGSWYKGRNSLSFSSCRCSKCVAKTLVLMFARARSGHGCILWAAQSPSENLALWYLPCTFSLADGVKWNEFPLGKLPGQTDNPDGLLAENYTMVSALDQMLNGDRGRSPGTT